MLIELDDQIARKYLPAAQAAKIPVDRVLSRQLAKFADVPVGARTLTLAGEQLEELDKLLGIGSTQHPQALLAAIRGWAGITLGDIRMDFAPAQLEELAIRAAKQGKHPQELVQDIVDQMSKDFFYTPVVAR